MQDKTKTIITTMTNQHHQPSIHHTNKQNNTRNTQQKRDKPHNNKNPFSRNTIENPKLPPGNRDRNTQKHSENKCAENTPYGILDTKQTNNFPKQNETITM